MNYHSSLKKTVAGLYTKTAVLDLESKIDSCMEIFISQMRKRTQQDDMAHLDMSSWVHLFSFDCLGELNVSKMFGFMERGGDFNGMIKGSDRILIKTGLVSGSSVLAVKMKLLTPMIVRTSSLAAVDTMD